MQPGKYYAFGQQLPRNKRQTIEANDTDGNEIERLERLFVSANESYDTLLTNIAATLRSLRTFKKVQELFPEAYQLLPSLERPCTGLAINITDLRKLL